MVVPVAADSGGEFGDLAVVVWRGLVVEDDGIKRVGWSEDVEAEGGCFERDSGPWVAGSWVDLRCREWYAKGVGDWRA